MKRKLRQSALALWSALPPVFTRYRVRTDYFNHVMPTAPDIMTLPTFTTVRETVRVKVGEAVRVKITGSAELDRRSSLRVGKISDVYFGVRFTDNFAAYSRPVGEGEPVFYGWEGDEPLPARYRLLDGTSCARSFPDLSVPRGGEHTFEHRFSFTLTEAGEVSLQPALVFTDESYHGSFFGAGVTLTFLFE